MRFSTLLPLLLAAGVVQAQRGGGGRGQGQQNNGQQAQQNNGQQAQQNNGQQAAQNNGQQAAQNNGQQNNDQANNGQANANELCLNQANVQTGSQDDGLADAEPGQAASDVDNANFINFCDGKTLTNGLQVQGGSCNGIVMGDIPSTANMVSAVFTNPTNGQQIAVNDDITFTVQVANLNAGSFTNPDSTYYAAPQAVDGGKITGHTHITCQFLGANDNPAQPLNAQNFDFFKGINDDGDGQGALSATLEGGLPQVGFYRVCSMTSASNHQPVIMPVAQRGPQDDCIRFEVVDQANAGQNNDQQQQGQANNGQQQGQQQQGQQQQGQQQGQQQQGQQQQGQQQGQAQQGQQQQGQQQGQQQQGQAQQGQAQQGQAQQGQAQQGQAQQGQAQQGQAQQGQAQQGQAQQGQAQQGQAQQGQAQQGQAQQGQAQQGQAQQGQAQQGQAQQGQAQQGQAQQGQQGGGRGGRFGRPKFQARDFVA